MQRFLPFLPDGEAAGAGGEALAVIADDLEWLLTANAGELWAVARSDPSLALLVATFLQYAKRPYDAGFSQQPATVLAIWQRMLPLLHRLVCGEERGAPSRADRAAMLSRLLDFPRILDICSLYGPAAAAAAPGDPLSRQLSQLVASALQLLPALGAQAAQASPLVAQNLGQVAEACLTAAGAAGRDAAMMQSLQDGVAYLRDTFLTLAALIQAHPPCAALLLQQGPGLIEALGAVHDQLLPAVHWLARTPGSADVLLPVVLRQACHVELCSERLAQLLLLHGYLQPAAEGAAAAAGSSSAGGSGGSGVARGEALLHALMLLGHREEEAGAGGAGGGAGGNLSLGQALAQRLGLGGSVLAAIRSGTVSLDDAQADYVAAMLGLSSLEDAPGPPLPGGADAAQLLAPGDRAGGKAAAQGLDLATLKSKIQQVKDLLPDYGEGFIAACLQQLGNSPERVLNALLEGNLPAQVSSLDPKLTLPAWQAAADTSGAAGGASSAGDKGKRSVAAPAGTFYESDFPATLPGAGGSAAGPSSAGAAGAAGAAQRAENKTARYLDVREETYREALVSAANAAQWEYDDEYDDSFDDLVAYGADGVTEAEGDGAAASAWPATRGAAPPGPALPAGAPAFQPGRGPASAPQGGGRPLQAGPGGRGPKAKGSKLWVLDGRIYNYPKPGAQEVGSQHDADAMLVAAEQAAAAVMGLGPGGNKPWRAQEQPAQTGGEGEGSGGGADGGGAAPGGGRGGRGGRGPGGAGRDRFKDQHKGAIGNHHRRDRATAKQARGMW